MLQYYQLLDVLFLWSIERRKCLSSTALLRLEARLGLV